MAGKPWCNACGAFTVCRHDGVQRGTTARKVEVHDSPPAQPGRKRKPMKHGKHEKYEKAKPGKGDKKPASMPMKMPKKMGC